MRADASTGPAVRVEGLAKRFGATKALNGVDLEVAQGTVFALLGPNGAGKTTLVRVLATLLEPDGGRAEVFGHDVVADAAAARELLGLTGQFAAVDEILSGRENLHMFGRLFGLSVGEARRRAAALLERFELAEAADRPAKTYSGGMRRRLDLASSLLTRPRILFLDEPTTGLDPRSRNEIWAIVRELVGEGTTLLLTTPESLLQRVPAPGRVSERAIPLAVGQNLDADWLHDTLVEIERGDESYGTNTSRAGEKTLIEFVSANPAGPISVVNGRAAAAAKAAAVCTPSAPRSWRLTGAGAVSFPARKNSPPMPSSSVRLRPTATA